MKLSERMSSQPSKRLKFECSTEAHTYIHCSIVHFIHVAFFILFFLSFSFFLGQALVQLDPNNNSHLVNMQFHIYSITSFIQFLHFLYRSFSTLVYLQVIHIKSIVDVKFLVMPIMSNEKRVYE